MRRFNKLFIIALPRCATVSMCDAVGLMGIPTAHLGRIYGEQTQEHNNPSRLRRMHEQIVAGDYALDILEQCAGLADYPVCSFDVLRHLDEAYPGSVFINVRRDQDVSRWLQSVERQFVGLQLLKAGRQSTAEEQAFMRVMLAFREMTFGQAKFEAAAYEGAYHRYQSQIEAYFGQRPANQLLDIADISSLEVNGFEQLGAFLECDPPSIAFPKSNSHSELPSRVFMQALEAGEIQSQTGIKPVGC